MTRKAMDDGRLREAVRLAAHLTHERPDYALPGEALLAEAVLFLQGELEAARRAKP